MEDLSLMPISSKLKDHSIESGRIWYQSGRKWEEYRIMLNQVVVDGWARYLAPRLIRVSPSSPARMGQTDVIEVASLQAEMAGLRAMESQVSRSLSAMKVKKVCLDCECRTDR